jgi:hypothetical protein
MMIYDWERDNYGYSVGFNGRSGGYLVLTGNGSFNHVLPYDILENETYEDYKNYCREEYGSVKANRDSLVYYVTLVRSFDKLCDDLREYCDYLSQQSFEITEMQKAVEAFNDNYATDLEFLEFQFLTCDEQGIVDLSEILNLHSLTEAFLRIAKRSDEGYVFDWLPEGRVRLKQR